MKSKELLQAIWRVEYRNEEGKLVSTSVFFRYKEDAQEYAELSRNKDCTPYISKYYLK